MVSRILESLFFNKKVATIRYGNSGYWLIQNNTDLSKFTLQELTRLHTALVNWIGALRAVKGNEERG